MAFGSKLGILGGGAKPAKAKPTPMSGDPMSGGDPGPGDEQDSGQHDIENDPEAMQCVDKLQQLGYTGQEVAQAMDSLGSGQQDSGDDGGGMTAMPAKGAQAY